MYTMQKLKYQWLTGLVLVSLLVLKVPAAFAGNSGARAVPEALVYAESAGSGHPGADDSQWAVIVDKHRQQVNLYVFHEYWRNLAQWPCSTGKSDGPKEKEGDQKTPEGIYFVVRNVAQRYLSPTYGARALPLDYPNWLDRCRNRSGSAIWIHGTNKPLLAYDSNGCVVLENESITQLAPHIRPQQTPVIIVDRLRLCSVRQSQATAQKILPAIDQWHRAMMHGDYLSFSHWYARPYQPAMAWWQQWCRWRSRLGNRRDYESVMRQRSIFKLNYDYVVLFDHVLIRGDRQSPVGRRKLFLNVQNGDVRIIGDTYQSRPEVPGDPLFLAWHRLNRPLDKKPALTSGLGKGQGSSTLEGLRADEYAVKNRHPVAR